ncbi:uncharacterized protein LOC127286792 [Leptopilina boulardi]|uniref:uncharacterized protein LOC127286792 n=1 Tax=Leptopilina boulardi TaxID=63433 RepID=UPI0021F59A18|nr:uncharacterized protein LOC127286792 [Leptopilina boulardi]
MSLSHKEMMDFLQKQVEFVLNDKNLSNLKFQFSNACKDGENFLGSLYRVKINGEKNGENKELNLIIKCIPNDEKLSILLRGREIFLNEIALYEERMPIIMNFLKEFNLQYNDCPAYYGGCKTPRKEALENEDQHYVNKIKRLKENAQQAIDYACDSRNAEPYATFNHGDLWTCNMLFKYNENSEPEDVRFLDFQLNRYGSPAMDILYTFFTCLTQEMRDKYYDELLHHYHDSLSQLLKKLNCDIEKLFPFDVLLEHLQRFGSYGACMSVIDIHLFTARDIDDPQPLYHIDFLRTLPTLLKTNKLYHQILRDSLKDMVDRNYI